MNFNGSMFEKLKEIDILFVVSINILEERVFYTETRFTSILL